MSGMMAPPAPADEPMDQAEVLSAVCDVLSTSGDERIESVEECDGPTPYVVMRTRCGRMFRLTVHRHRPK